MSFFINRSQVAREVEPILNLNLSRPHGLTGQYVRKKGWVTLDFYTDENIGFQSSARYDLLDHM